MIEIDGFWWFVGAVVVCGAHTLHLWGWKREQRQHHAWWVSYDARAEERHDEFMRALDNTRPLDDDDAAEGDDADQTQGEQA